MENIQIFNLNAMKTLKEAIKKKELDTAYYREENTWIEPWLEEQGERYIHNATDLHVSFPELRYEETNNNRYDLENAISLYESLPLQPYQATDMRLWVYLTHYTYWEYMKHRWPEPPKQNPESNILVRYFDGEKPFSRNGIARLWWSVHLTVDENARIDEEKYKYTKLFWNDQDKVDNLSAYNLCHIKPLLWAVLTAYEAHPEKFTNREIRRLFIKQFNQFGGIKCLGFFDNAALRDIVETQAILFKP